MAKPSFIILALGLICFSSLAFAANYNSVDRRAIGTPVSFETDINKLTSYLTDNWLEEDKKARAIAVWIAYRIEYDDYKNQKIMARVANGSGTIPTNGDAFITRKGVCSDFAILFYRMATAAGLKAAIITGWVKDGGSNDSVSAIKHAWNAVRLNGSWYLLDVTWSAKNLVDTQMSDRQYARDIQRRMQGKKNIYRKIRGQADNKDFNDEWFLISPQDMVQSHFPDNPEWQLLNPPVRKSAFFN